MASAPARLCQFIHEISYEALPAAVRHQVKRCLLDLMGCVVAGSLTPAARIAERFAGEQWPGQSSFVPVFGTRCHPTGAAFAGAVMANALDIDEGFRLVKGHPGAGVIPAALAVGCERGAAGRELLAAIAVGYEVAIRTGLLTHATYSDYHASGSWVAVGAAACAARLLGLGHEATLQALGIAEYHAPISPMVRCLDVPSMVKDGLGWGSMVGVSSVYLARAGFTGINPVLLEKGEESEVSTLGDVFHIERVYFKPYACCRWAHPAVAAALALAREHDLSPEDVAEVVVETVSVATHLRAAVPHTTEEAQYSIPYPVAAALVHGRVGPREVLGDCLRDSRVLALARRVRLRAAEDLEREFPQRCLARVHIRRSSGEWLRSEVFASPWDADTPPTDAELGAKFREMSGLVLPAARATELEELIWNAERVADASDLLRATVADHAKG